MLIVSLDYVGVDNFDNFRKMDEFIILICDFEKVDLLEEIMDEEVLVFFF